MGLGREQKKETQMDDMKLLWSWYKYHATQRLQSFNFFVIFVGALLVFLETQLGAVHPTFIRALSIAGVALSISFFLLDLRNAHLVNLASDRIVRLKTAPTPLFVEVVSARNEARSGWKMLTGHGFVLRAITICSAVLFAVLALKS
jgi:hypothetical protein